MLLCLLIDLSGISLYSLNASLLFIHNIGRTFIMLLHYDYHTLLLPPVGRGGRVG